MQVTYTNTFRDLIRFNLYHQPRMGVIQLIVAALVVFHTWTFGRYVWKLPDSPAVKAILFVGTLLFMLALLAVVQLFTILLSYRPSKNKALLTEHVIRVTDDELIEETAFGSNSTTWAGIPKVGRNRSYVFVYVQQNMAHVIPIRAFASITDASSFFDLVRSRSASARSASSN
ncbi:MAG TPA: YcxB family protein [Thermoanaerobaculia bacterium]|nr:YcxB family protein [Thermoanaerobaculia bacterium]